MASLDQLTDLLARRSTKRGHFVLASGRESTLYVDARLTTMSPDGLALIGPLGLAAVREAGWQVDSVGGLTLGADPVATAMLHAAADGAGFLDACVVRKEGKAHGLQRRIEGPDVDGRTVLVVEDVSTTGGSALNAVRAVREAGGTVAGVLALVDREEGGREALEGEGLEVRALVRASALVSRLGVG